MYFKVVYAVYAEHEKATKNRVFYEFVGMRHKKPHLQTQIMANVKPSQREFKISINRVNPYRK